MRTQKRVGYFNHILSVIPVDTRKETSSWKLSKLSDFSREFVVRFVPFLYYEDGFSCSSVTHDYFCLFIGRKYRKAGTVRRKIPCRSCILQVFCFAQICVEQQGNRTWYIYMGRKSWEDPGGKRKVGKTPNNSQFWQIPFCGSLFQGVGNSIKISVDVYIYLHSSPLCKALLLSGSEEILPMTDSQVLLQMLSIWHFYFSQTVTRVSLLFSLYSSESIYISKKVINFKGLISTIT